jgi:transposase
MPSFVARPQGGGRAPVADRAVFTAVVYVLTSGCPWRLLPPSFGVTVPTAHRRFTEWTKAGLWRRLHQAVLDELVSQGLIDWSRAVVDGAAVRAKRGISDRSEPGRPRQARFKDPRAVRPCRPAVVSGLVGGEHQRYRRAQTSHTSDPRDQVPPRTTPPQTSQVARGQGLRPRRSAHVATRPRHHRPDRPQKASRPANASADTAG